MGFVRATAIVALALLVAACQAQTPPGSPASSAFAKASPTATPSSTPSATISHVVVVWLENREASAISAATMPYLYGLSQTYGRADQFYAITHPSLPNYLAFWSGSTQGVTDDADHNLAATSLSNQMAAAGRSWRTYAQDYPAGGCNTGSAYSGRVDGPGVAGTYARKHNPAMSFTFVSDSDQCANIQPLANFDPGVNFAFVAPNLCNDMHDCSPARGDAFLQAFLPTVFAAPEWAHTLLVVSFDEGTTNVHGGGRVFTMVARRGLAGVTSTTPHDHYGLLRTIQNIFGLPCLNASCDATPLGEFLP
jgi:acid phosphatase